MPARVKPLVWFVQEDANHLSYRANAPFQDRAFEATVRQRKRGVWFHLLSWDGVRERRARFDCWSTEEVKKILADERDRIELAYKKGVAGLLVDGRFPDIVEGWRPLNLGESAPDGMEWMGGCWCKYDPRPKVSETK